jgi:hypothetical protein
LSGTCELSLHLSSDGKAVTFMGYDAAVNDLDVSNSNSPNHVDPTNPVTGLHARVVAETIISAASQSSTTRFT